MTVSTNIAVYSTAADNAASTNQCSTRINLSTVKFERFFCILSLLLGPDVDPNLKKKEGDINALCRAEVTKSTQHKSSSYYTPENSCMV
jgi:hypothetical protein